MAICGVELGEDVGYVVAHSLAAEDEVLGDLIVAPTGGDQVEYLSFALGEGGERG